jgi:hypothetical protein
MRWKYMEYEVEIGGVSGGNRWSMRWKQVEYEVEIGGI